MALSNWDTCAFDRNGNPSIGRIAKYFRDGAYASVEIYKNWIYVHDTKMWAVGRCYVEPTIAEIHKGNISISSFNIFAARGSQQSILCYVCTGYKSDADFNCMCGLGCYGFDGEVWTGVLQKTVFELIKFLEELERSEETWMIDKEYIDLIRKAIPVRFNQGDAYFVGEDNSMTDIGKSEKPILMKLFS
jgi:hypothetical protein